MNYNSIINKARVLSDTQNDTKNSSTKELLVFLNIVVKNIYEDSASWANANISVFTPVTPAVVEASANSSVYNTQKYRIQVPEDLHTLIGLSYTNYDRNTAVSNVNLEEINSFYYFNYVDYADSLYIEYIPMYTDITDETLTLPKYLRINTTYMEYSLAILLARSAGDGDTASDLREEMKREQIYLRGSTGAYYL